MGAVFKPAGTVVALAMVEPLRVTADRGGTSDETGVVEAEPEWWSCLVYFETAAVAQTALELAAATVASGGAVVNGHPMKCAAY